MGDCPTRVAALEHRESVVAVGHVVASLQRGYVSTDAAKGYISPWDRVAGRPAEVAEWLPVPRENESAPDPAARRLEVYAGTLAG